MFAHIQQLYLSFRSNGILNRNICAMEVRLLQLFQNINYMHCFENTFCLSEQIYVRTK